MDNYLTITPIEIRTEPPFDFTKRGIIDCYRYHNFNITSTAQYYGVSRRHFLYIIDSEQELVDMIDDAHEGVLDDAEESLRNLVIDGNLRAVKYVLDTKGGDRGYGKKDDGLVLLKANNDIKVIKADMTPEEASAIYRESLE